MNLEEDILIEKFLSDKLTKKEQNHFLKKMESDILFRKKVRLEKQLSETLNDDDWSFIETNNTIQIKETKEILRSEEFKKLKNTIENVNISYQSSIKKKYKKWWLYASVAVVAILFSIYTFIDSSFSSQELFTIYLKNDNLPSLITREHTKNSLAEGQEYFENKDYAKAITIFKNELLQGENKNATVYIYLGIAQTQLNEFENAKTTFNELISSNMIDAPKGKWYKALLYLKMEQIDQSKSLLDEIIKENAYNSKEARELLRKLP